MRILDIQNEVIWKPKSVNSHSCVDKNNSKSSTCAHLAHESQRHPDPEVIFRNKSGAKTGETCQDLTEGEDGSSSSDVDGEQDDEVGQHLNSSHQTSSLEQILFSRIETQPIEAHGNH